MTDAVILKTTDSGFSGFIRDRYTTLKETNDRILATSLTASWRYGAIDIDWNRSRQQIRTALLETFAGHKSLSVQQTLYAMGHAALDACSFIYQIALSMPNQHRVLVDLSPFDLTNDNEVFITTSEPFGLITATLKRE
jgi:urate oxidase